MEEELIAVRGGILGTRKLSSAYADLILRRAMLIREGQATVNAYLAWSSLRHRPWRTDELAKAKLLFARGMKVPAIAKVIRRTKFSVYKKFKACGISSVAFACRLNP